MEHDYSEDFYNFLQPRVRHSASVCVTALHAALRPESVLDVGCGLGTWLRAWSDAGVARVTGIDAPSAEQTGLLIPPACFVQADLEGQLPDVGRFDLAQCVEVAEHLTEDAGRRVVGLLTSSADTVLFGAARPGQGGEGHVTERPLAYWVDLFAERGFVPVDLLRPVLAGDASVLPWYRFNTLVFVRAADGVSPAGLRAALRAAPLPDGGDLRWRLRCFVGRRLPRSAMDRVAQVRARMLARRGRRAAAHRPA